MVGKINPSDDSNKIPPIQGLSFHTSSEQRAVNQLIAKLKTLVESPNANDPHVQQQIESLRNQIQYQDLPDLGLSNKRKPTVADAMKYIDQQSGYTKYIENAAQQPTDVSSSKRSKKSSWRQLAVNLPSAKIREGSPTDDLSVIKQNLVNWQAANPDKLTAQVQTILKAIDTFSSNPSFTGDSLRSWMQLSSDANPNTGIKELFNTHIYSQVSKTALTSFFTAVGLDNSLLPSTTTPSTPPFKPGYVAYVFKNLPDYQPDGKTPTTIQVGGHLGGGAPISYINKINPDGSLKFTQDQTQGVLSKSQLPTFTDSDGKKQSYIYLPANYISGRIYYDATSATPGAAFTEFNMDPNGNPDVNFTAVDGIPKLTSNVELVGNDQLTNRNGIQTDQASFYAKMNSLYSQYDPSGAWKKNMFAADGTIRSGKHMSVQDTQDPTIQNSLSNYLSNTFMPQMAGKQISFLADGLPGKAPEVRTGHISAAPGGGWQFVIDGGTTPLKLPNTNDINGWISGAFGGGGPGDDDRTGAAKWGAAKALSSVINKGILPSDISPNQTINGASYFTDPNNVKNFYKAPFYNIYLRAMHEAGCSAYGADFDDYMGGDGSVGDDHRNQPAVIITFGATSAPPGPPPFDPSTAVDELWNHVYTSSERNIPHDYEAYTESVERAAQTYQTDLTTYNNLTNPTDKLNYYNKTLQPAYNSYQQSYSAVKGYAGIMLFDNRDDVTKILQLPQPITDDEIDAMASEMEKRYIPSVPPLPGPPGPTPPELTPTNLTIGFYKDNLNAWLARQPGEKDFAKTGVEGYLRKNFADPIFSKIDSGQITTVADMQNWLNNDPEGMKAMQGLLSPNIYTQDPDLKAMDPSAAQAELTSLFKTLGLTAPVPTPGPPSTDDVQYLLNNNPNTVRPFYNNTLAQLETDIRNHASSQDMATLVTTHMKQLQNYLQTTPGIKLPPGVTDTLQLAKELCRQEWKDAGAPGTCPV